MKELEALWSRLAEIPYFAPLFSVAGVLVLCVVAYWVARRVIVRGLAAIAKRTQTSWDDIFISRGVFDRLAWLAPAMVIHQFAYVFTDDAQGLVHRLVFAFVVLVVLSAFSRFLDTVNVIYQTTPRSRELPIKGYLQIVQLLAVLIGIIVVVSTILDRSPWGILSGLGAATAILLLVFRDTILSFVASIQLATNDMVRIGDWITMDQYGADGDVIDVALHTVKVQNWDKTISTIPTHKLMGESFRNWRGMSESGGRRIARAVNIDMTSIRFLTPQDLESYAKVKLLEDYLKRKLAELREWNESRQVDPDSPLNARRLTNLGTFRAYLVAYLRASPVLRQDMTLIVRQLPPTAEGLPIQIYVFSADQVWANYENIQSDIFDHVLASIPVFDLRVYQSPSSYDVIALQDARRDTSPVPTSV